MRRIVNRHRYKAILAAICLLLVGHFFLNGSNYFETGTKTMPGGKFGKHASKETIRSIKDYTFFFEGLEAYKPKSESIKGKYKTTKAPEVFAGETETLLDKKFLENVLDIPKDTIKELKALHKMYMNKHVEKLIKGGVSTFGNMLPTDGKWSSYRGSKGYVFVGGGQYSWLAYLTIKQLRAVGSILPVEVFIPNKEEYEQGFCDHIKRKYNAECNVFDGALINHLGEKFGVGGFQYKILALMASKFENVMYIDSDNFPTRNIDYIFDSQLYKEKQLILWPDAWARTTNPYFYDIAGIPVKEKKVRYSAIDNKIAQAQGLKEKKPLSSYKFGDSRFHDFEGTFPDPTSETGMLVINKSSHLKTLLICMYYNLFGPHYYYPLLTQGSAGEGDKETFIAAAHVAKEPWFQTRKEFQWVGYHGKQGFSSKALGHYDPIKSRITSDDLDLIFMHLSYPLFYPNWLVDNRELINEDNNHVRMYEAIYENVGYDFDLRVLQFFTQGMCPNYYDETTGKAIDDDRISKDEEFMGPFLSYVPGREQWCADVFIPHLRWLKETTKYPISISVQPR